MTTKREIINRAYSAAGLASYAFDLSAEELLQARQSLDSMAAMWTVKGVRMAYNAEPEMDAEAGVPDWAEEALVLNLALRLCGVIGKPVMPETKQAAREAYTAMVAAATQPLPTLARMVPAGAGNRFYARAMRPFIDQQAAPLLAGDDSELELGA